MGFVFAAMEKILVAALVFVVIAYFPGLAPNLEFNSYSVTPSMPLEGNVALNNRLNNAEHLFENEIGGPECFADFKGELYTGLKGGDIIKISNGKIVPVAKFGQPCAGVWEEDVCGRPLGMKFGKNGSLYVADAYYGVFKIDVKTGIVTKLVSMSVPIEGRVPMLPNSVEIASDGTVYWTDSSQMQLIDGLFHVFGDGSGRLLKYDPNTNSSTVMLDKLFFANGVVLSAEEDYVLVVESLKQHIRRYYLRGPKEGTSDIFIDGLPGTPDNLKSDGSDGYYVPLFAASDIDHPSLVEKMSTFPTLRKFFARLLALVKLPFKQIELIYPNYYTNRAIHWLGLAEPMYHLAAPFMPKRSTVLHIDAEGNITESLHCLDGTLSWTSDFHLFNGAYYVGSPINNYVGRVQMIDPMPSSIPTLAVPNVKSER